MCDIQCWNLENSSIIRNDIKPGKPGGWRRFLGKAYPFWREAAHVSAVEVTQTEGRDVY